MRRVRRATLETYAHQDLPVREPLKVRMQALERVRFNLLNFPPEWPRRIGAFASRTYLSGLEERDLVPLRRRFF